MDYVRHVRRFAALARPVRIAADFANAMGIYEAKALAGLIEIISCPGAEPQRLTLDMPTTWLSLPPEGVPVSADGQTISGTWVRTEGDEKKTSVWSFTLVRD